MHVNASTSPWTVRQWDLKAYFLPAALFYNRSIAVWNMLMEKWTSFLKSTELKKYDLLAILLRRWTSSRACTDVFVFTRTAHTLTRDGKKKPMCIKCLCVNAVREVDVRNLEEREERGLLFGWGVWKGGCGLLDAEKHCYVFWLFDKHYSRL